MAGHNNKDGEGEQKLEKGFATLATLRYAPDQYPCDIVDSECSQKLIFEKGWCQSLG